jgi:hypothetical protein
MEGCTRAADAAAPRRRRPQRLGRRRLGARCWRAARARARRSPHDPAAASARKERPRDDLRRHRRPLPRSLAPAIALTHDAGTAAGCGPALHLVCSARWRPWARCSVVAYTLTGRVARLFPGAEASDVRATAKALVGAVCFLVWTLLLAAAAWVAAGPWAALLALVGVPPLLLLALLTAEGWAEAWRDARRFLVLHRRAARVAGLRARQAELAARVEALVARLETLAARPRASQAAAPAGVVPSASSASA